MTCPSCGGDRKELISGREFMIKEIVATPPLDESELNHHH